MKMCNKTKGTHHIFYIMEMLRYRAVGIIISPSDET